MIITGGFVLFLEPCGRPRGLRPKVGVAETEVVVDGASSFEF